MRYVFLLSLLIAARITASAQFIPTNLRTDLLLYTGQVWSNGFLTNLTLEAADSAHFVGQMALIQNKRPSFSWM